MEEIFGRNGLIASAHPEYEYRPGQIQMAEAVLRAFDEKRHLIVEAGTGTGKTLAYLVPAIAAAVARGGRIVISTGTKNLQEQLMEKDIPFLQRVLPKKFTAAYMKGRTNYVCLQRVKRAETTPILEGLDDVDHFEEVRRWSRESETGDRAELTDLPENLSFWRHIDARIKPRRALRRAVLARVRARRARRRRALPPCARHVRAHEPFGRDRGDPSRRILSESGRRARAHGDDARRDQRQAAGGREPPAAHTRDALQP